MTLRLTGFGKNSALFSTGSTTPSARGNNTAAAARSSLE
jgi:hypothetical protein